MQALTVQRDDIELYVQVHGDSQKPSIVLLHGYPDSHASWHHQIDALKQDFQVITFDMRGVGQSTWSARRNAYHMNHLLADIEAVINASVGAQGQVHLVGHDWGSVIGWSFISDARYARRVLSYTSMSGPHLRLMLDWARRNILSGNPKRIAQALRQGLFSWYVYLFNIPVLPEFIFRQFGKTIWQKILSSNGVDHGDSYLNTNQSEVEGICLNTLNLYRQNPLNPPELPEPKSIDVPVQLLIPRQDRFVSEQLFEFYDEYVNTLHRHYIDGKHWAHHSHQALFNSQIKQFITQVDHSV
ncbi:alpha/beta fold hydrolase [Alkalimarinus coralli]|uniref:alpha/beta fold hydrolase n=1 Tax=Alkalimarinus coralli TaxID=2935863 RepID=UPI00202B0111|nr:alpha/beta fold hydrolase [Alkalimarinus coralli]